jgi:bifunctional NMN adenylyltransferase/nudix hydrolase
MSTSSFFENKENPMATRLPSVGVIVGRFHLPQPHNGHRALVRHVMAPHETVLMALGVSAGLPNDHDPLPYDIRESMMLREFPGIEVAPLKDVRDDTAWSASLDACIKERFPGRNAILYGSRQSFIGSYSGEFETVLVPEADRSSGTQVRERIKRKPSLVTAFRRGVIWAIMNRPPITYPTVDIAIVNYDLKKVLLGRKPHDPPGTYRFIGGFVDPEDQSYEAATRREKREETGDCEIGPLIYTGSHRVDDWRYRGTKDGIMTMLFRAAYIYGCPEPADDIDELRWFDFDQYQRVLVPEHRPLGEMLGDSLIAEGHMPARSLEQTA